MLDTNVVPRGRAGGAEGSPVDELFFKPDRRRDIDRYIDYFGNNHHDSAQEIERSEVSVETADPADA